MIYFDDCEIDQIIWSAITASQCASDFSTYLSHNPQGASHLGEAEKRFKSVVDASAQAPSLFPDAVKAIQTLAETGDARAQFHMGKFYGNGHGVEKDIKLAEYWYLKAVTSGELRAYFNLGMTYLRSEEVGSKARGLQLLKFASDQGEMRSRAEVGMAGDVPLVVEG